MQRLKRRTTTNKGWLFTGGIFGLFFSVIGVIAIYKGIHYGIIFGPIVYDGFQSGELKGILPILIIGFVLIMFVLFVLIFLGSGLSVLIMSIKGFFNLLKKQKIKRNKEWMKKIDAKVVSFELCGEVKKNGIHVSSVYYFTASDGLEKYDSEEFNATVTGGCGDMKETLELMEIHYDPHNKDNMIKALDERLHAIEISLQENKGINGVLLRGAYATTQQIKQNLESGIIPYMEFKGHKLSIGDKVEVYIDPGDPKNYWIDTNFLYS